MLKPVGEDFVKRYRLEYNLEALKRVRRDIGEIAHTRLRALIEYRLSGKDFDRSPTGAKVAVAFSGGSDSTATLKVLRWAGFDAIPPITVKLPPQMGEKTLEKARNYGAVFIEIPEYLDIIRPPQIEKGAPPICGRCHALVMSAVEGYARKSGIKIVASGDMLSSGLISIYQKRTL